MRFEKSRTEIPVTRKTIRDYVVLEISRSSNWRNLCPRVAGDASVGRLIRPSDYLTLSDHSTPDAERGVASIAVTQSRNFPQIFTLGEVDAVAN